MTIQNYSKKFSKKFSKLLNGVYYFRSSIFEFEFFAKLQKFFFKPETNLSHPKIIIQRWEFSRVLFRRTIFKYHFDTKITEFWYILTVYWLLNKKSVFRSLKILVLEMLMNSEE